MKRWLKTVFVLVAIFLLPTLWLLFSHIAAKRAVERYKSQLRAAGEKLTVDDWLPPRVPTEQTGAKLFLEAYPFLHPEGAIDTNAAPAMKMVTPGKAMIGWQQPYILDEYQKPKVTNTWKDIEADLTRYSRSLELLQRAAELP
jgi:hypothetical protein